MATVTPILTEPEFVFNLNLTEAKALKRLLDSRMEAIDDESANVLDELSVSLEHEINSLRRYY